jgi:hypothetical protein
MMFSREDFRVENPVDVLHMLPILLLLALVAPFIIAAYTLGFVMDVTGWLTSD